MSDGPKITKKYLVFAVAAHAILFFYSLLIYTFYFFPDKLFSGSIIAAIFSAFLVFYNIGLYKYIGFSFLKKYVVFLNLSRTIFSVFLLILVSGAQVWMFYIFDSFVNRLSYLSYMNQSLRQVELGSLVTPSPKILADAFSLYPGRKEVPFLIANASRTLTFSDSQKYFSNYMSEFVNNLDLGKLDKYFLKADVLEAGNVRVFIANCITQAKYNGDGLREAINYLNKDGEISSFEKIYSAVLQFSLDHDEYIFALIENDDSYLKNFDKKLQKQTLTNNIKELENIIETAQNSTQQQVFAYATSHAFQKALDTLAQAYFLMQHFADVDISNAELKKEEDYISKAIDMYRRILVLRERLVTREAILWFSGPRTLTIYHYFEAKSGSRNKISEGWVEVLRKIAPLAIDRLDKEIFAATAFEKFRDLDYWNNGTPLAVDFRGAKSKQMLEEWLKNGW